MKLLNFLHGCPLEVLRGFRGVLLLSKGLSQLLLGAVLNCFDLMACLKLRFRDPCVRSSLRRLSVLSSSVLSFVLKPRSLFHEPLHELTVALVHHCGCQLIVALTVSCDRLVHRFIRGMS